MNESDGLRADRRAHAKAHRSRDKAALRACDTEAEPAPPRPPQGHHQRPERSPHAGRHWKLPFWKRRSRERVRRAQEWYQDTE